MAIKVLHNRIIGGAAERESFVKEAAMARLVRPFAASLKLPYSYWIVCPKPTASLPKIATFREWLLAEAAADARRIKRAAAKARR